MKAVSRSPRERAHIEAGPIGFKNALARVKAGACELCGDEYETDNLCPSCENTRIMRLAYGVVTDLAASGKLFEIMKKGEEAIPKFDDFYSLRDIYSDEDEEE